MIIGDAHDQSALAFHQVLHAAHHFLFSSCPGLSRASTPSGADRQDVDGRDGARP
jgi:hypothetical protein